MTKGLLPLLGCACVLAQEARVKPLFEVASIRRLPADHLKPLSRQISPAGVILRNATLGNCIEWAYGFPHSLVVGPEWRDRPTDVVYDIVANSGKRVPESQLKAMLQSLLQQRLGLKVHREKSQLPVYALVVDRRGPKFRRSVSTGDMSVQYLPDGTRKYERISMAEFARTMNPPFTSRYVIDETGMEGVYDFTLDLTAYITDTVTGKEILDSRGAVDLEPAYLQALPKQLGLRLERKTAGLDVLVIDEVAKDPGAN